MTLASRVAERLRGRDEVLVGQMEADEETLLGCPLFCSAADLVEAAAHLREWGAAHGTDKETLEAWAKDRVAVGTALRALAEALGIEDGGER